MNNLTVYQGPDRQYGWFECKPCKRNWHSGHTWANTGQKCKNCNAMVYPFNQVPLQQADASYDAAVPHPEHLCGKCIKLGHSCKEHK